MPLRLRGAWERPGIRKRESEKELENLFNSLTLRLSLDSFSASPIKRMGAGRRITRSGSLRTMCTGSDPDTVGIEISSRR